MSKGFSLIEIMLAMFIVAILMAMSFPYYAQHNMQQNRLAAATDLLRLAAALEHYFMENNSYADASLQKLGVAEFTANKQYQLRISEATTDGFLLIAEPLAKQAQDKECAALTLNAAGEKNITGSGDVAGCW